MLKNFKFSKSLLHGIGEDVPFPQNAHPSSIVPPDIKSYLSLSPDGKPLRTKLLPADLNEPKEEDWETDDYIEIPEINDRIIL